VSTQSKLHWYAVLCVLCVYPTDGASKIHTHYCSRGSLSLLSHVCCNVHTHQVGKAFRVKSTHLGKRRVGLVEGRWCVMSPWKHGRRRKCLFSFSWSSWRCNKDPPEKLLFYFFYFFPWTPSRLGSLEGSRVKSCNAGFDVCYLPIFPIFALIA
jgi:hypothetical protein